MRKKIIIAVGCSASALSLLLAGCSGNSTNGDSTNTSGVVTSANAEVTDSNVTTNSGEIPYIDISWLKLVDEKAGLFSPGDIIFNIDGEIIDYDRSSTIDSERKNIADKVYGNVTKYVISDVPYLYDGQRYYKAISKTSELSGDTVKASIINSNATVVFETVPKSYSNYSPIDLKNHLLYLNDLPYFISKDGEKEKIYKIDGEDTEFVCEIEEKDHIIGDNFFVNEIWSDGFLRAEDGIYKFSGEKLFDYVNGLSHNSSNGCFLQNSDNVFKLYDNNGNLLLDLSTLDIGGAEIYAPKLFEGENTEDLVYVNIKNVNGSTLYGIVDKTGNWVLEPSADKKFYGIKEKVGDYYFSDSYILDKNFEIIANADDTVSFEDKIVYIDKKDFCIKRLDTSTGEIKTLFYGY